MTLRREPDGVDPEHSDGVPVLVGGQDVYDSYTFMQIDGSRAWEDLDQEERNVFDRTAHEINLKFEDALEDVRESVCEGWKRHVDSLTERGWRFDFMPQERCPGVRTEQPRNEIDPREESDV